MANVEIERLINLDDGASSKNNSPTAGDGSPFSSLPNTPVGSDESTPAETPRDRFGTANERTGDEETGNTKNVPGVPLFAPSLNVESPRTKTEIAHTPRGTTEVQFHIDVKANNLDKLDDNMKNLVRQSKECFQVEFNEKFEEQISKKGGYRLTCMVGASDEEQEQEAGLQQLLALAMFKIMPDQRALSLAFLAVPKSRRRMGYGKMMIKHVIAYGKKQKSVVREIGLSSLPSSIKFYKSLGFRVDKAIKTTGAPRIPRTDGGNSPVNGNMSPVQNTSPTNGNKAAVNTTQVDENVHRDCFIHGQVYMYYPIRNK